MVQIKTGPDKTNKTTADLNENLQRLNTNIETLLKKREEAKAKADKDQEDKDKPKLLKELAKVLKGSEASKQYGNGLNLAVAGLTGAAFPLVAKLNIDKMVGTTLKYAKDYVKKKWAESAAGKSSSSSKINSAVESNKQSGTHRRLDKITGLLQYIAHKPKDGEEAGEKQSFFGRVLTFLSSLLGGILNSGVVKLLGSLAILGNIYGAIRDLLNGLGIKGKPSQVTAATQGAIHGLNIGANKGIENTGALIDNLKAEKAAKTKLLKAETNWKNATEGARLTSQEKVKALSSEENLNKIIKEKNLTKTQATELKSARNNLKTTTAEINKSFTPEQAGKIGTWAESAARKQTWVGKILNKMQPGANSKLGWLWGESKFLKTARPFLKWAGPIGVGLDALAHGWEAKNAKTKEEKEEAIMGGLGSIGGGLLAGLAVAGTIGTGGILPLVLAGIAGAGGAIGGDWLARIGVRNKHKIPLNMNMSEYMASLDANKEESLNNILAGISPDQNYNMSSDTHYFADEFNGKDLTNITTNTYTTNDLLTNIDDSLQKILGAIGYQFQNRNNPTNSYNKPTYSNPPVDQTEKILTPNKPNIIWSN